MIYVIGSPELPGRVKIGYSSAPHRRIRGLQAGCPVRLELLATFPGDFLTEMRLHDHFAADRLHGEWFAVTLNEVETALPVAVRLEAGMATEIKLRCSLDFKESLQAAADRYGTSMSALIKDAVGLLLSEEAAGDVPTSARTPANRHERTL